jgi:transcriptional regulator with XRE-family HTH domain
MLDDVITNSDVDKGTAGADLTEEPSISETRTETRLLTEDIGFHRSQARDLHGDFDSLHQQSHILEWNQRTAERARASLSDMLDELADLGFSWRDVARLVGVSVPALQKWRRGDKASGESRGRVAALLAACDLIKDHYLVADVAQWFEVPVVLDCPVTPIDIYASERRSLVFDLAGGHSDPEQILTSFDPEWRDRYRSDFETFRAGDGRLSVRPKQ